MKSRISCFKTAVRKDLTRFAPAWGGYLLCLLLGLMIMADGSSDLGVGRSFANLISVIAIVNLFYGLLTSQLLFGDLCSTRMCYGLHSLPLRREDWFAAHFFSGMLFSLVPTVLMTALAALMSIGGTLEKGWQLPLYFLLATNLQYLFFFGAGTLSILLGANRYGGILIYGIINFGAVLAFYVCQAVFIPMLYGMVEQPEPFMHFSPVVQMVDYSYFRVETFKSLGPNGSTRWGTFTLTSNWWYLWVCAGVGLVLTAAAMLLYRRRNLERAGDLLAVKALEPVFAVVFSIVCAMLLHFCARELFGLGQHYVLMLAGLAAGWFFGRMLLQRSLRVFGLGSWLGLGALTAVLALTVLAAKTDVLGLETRVPDKEDIRSVTVSQSRYSDPSMELVLTDPEDIENVLFIHGAALRSRLEESQTLYMDEPVPTAEVEGLDRSQIRRSTPVLLTYRLKNGTTMARLYHIWTHEPEGQLLKGYLSTLRVTTGMDELVYSPVQHFSVDGCEVPRELWTREEVDSLLRALTLDAEEGSLAQPGAFHTGDPVLVYDAEWGRQAEYSYWLFLDTENYSLQLEIYSDTEHTVQWIRSRGFDQLIADRYG